MNMEKMKAAFSDEAFVKSLFALDTAAEVQAALQEKGVELSEEEILSIRALLTKVESGELSLEQLESWQQQAEDGELSDEALEQVAGGAFITALIVKSVIVGAIWLVGMGTLVTGHVKESTGRHW